ncbi:MAG: tetratricopeptide repeat protein [Pseudomonadota bacterium]
MAEKKPKRKELLNEPDEFITWSAIAVEYARNNYRSMVMGACAVVVVGLLLLGYFAYRNHRQTTSHEILESALREYSAISGLPDDKITDQQDRVFDSLDKISKDYGDLPSGEIALLYSAHMLYSKGDFQGALDRYKKFQSSGIAMQSLGPLALYNIAQSYMALRDFEKAMASFDQLSKDVNSPYRREAYSSIARIYEMMNKKKEAAQAYKQYLKVFPEAPDADFVKTKISQLLAQG